MEGDMKGVVIIKLPPPESPSDGKIITAAFAFQNHLPPHQDHAHETIDVEQHHQLIHQFPLHNRPPRRFRPFRSKRLASFLFVVLIGYFLWQYGPTSLYQDDSDSQKSERSMVYTIYSKVLTMNSSSNDPASLSPLISKLLVQRDGVRNDRRVSNAVGEAKDEEGTSTTVFPLRGNVYPHGLYYVSLRVGTPPKQYFLDVDTGSDIAWLQCDAPCTSCAKGPHPLYKPRRTNLVDCKEPICSSVQAANALACQGGSSQCDYEIQYADGGSSLGVLVSDQMTVLLSNGSVVRTKAIFGCAYDQQGPLANSPAHTDGVLGLSSSSVSLPSQWAEQGLIKNIIAHCISGSSGGGGYLFFGDKLLPSWGITWAPMLGKPSMKNYALAVENIYFGDAMIDTGGKALGSAFFDSGTSYTYLVSPVYTAVVSVISDSLIGSGLQRDELDDTLPVCWHSSSPFRSLEDVQHLFRTMVLEFKGSGWLKQTRKLQISPEGYLIINSKGNVCLGVLDANVLGSHSANIIGDISMQGNLVVYDNENNRIGWMKSDCRKLPRNAAQSPSI